MSTNNDEQQQEKYVTKEYLEAFMGAALQANNEMQEQQMKSQFSSLMSGIENKLAPLVAQVNEITAAINTAAQQQAQQQAPAAPPQQRLTMPDLINFIKEGAGAYKDIKSAAYGETTELDKWGMAAAEVAKREAINAMKLQVRHGLRKNVITRDAVENIVGDVLETAGGADHKPIL